MNKRTVLIAEDEPAILQALAFRFSNNGFDVDTATNGVEAILKMKKRIPDIMIVDVDMPEADGFRVCERMSELQMARFPVIMLTRISDPESVRRCEQLGAHHMLKSRDMWDKVQSRVNELLQSGEPAASPPAASEPAASPATVSEPAGSIAPARSEDIAAMPAKLKVLVVDDDPHVTKVIKIRLANYGVETLEADNGMDGYIMVLKEMPDVVITDYLMPEGSGDHMLVRIKQNPVTRHIPVIVLTGRVSRNSTDHGFRRDIMGRRSASALLPKPLDFDDLITELQRHISEPLELRH